MALKTSSTGSWPPLYDLAKGIDHLDPEKQDLAVRKSTERAIQEQIELGLDVLVDGQVRDDIVSLFVRKLNGYDKESLPYRIHDPIQPAPGPITVGDYELAKGLVGDRPLKAHLTGPMTLARNSRVKKGSGYSDKTDPRLVLDLARALGEEARRLVEAGAEIVQIDEPVLASIEHKDLDLAFEAMKMIVDTGGVPFPALHACANVTSILEDILVRAPVKMVSIEGRWLTHESLRHIDGAYLADCGKLIGLGCIKVDDYQIERRTQVLRFLDPIVDRLGEGGVWALMPNCGLRPVPREIALEKLKVMVAAARSFQTSME